MKKLGFLVFMAALIIGILSAVKLTPGFSYFGKSFVFSIGKVEGSGLSKTEIRDLKDFSSIDVSGAINVEVLAQRDFNVTIEADDNLLEYIQTEVSGDTLKIYSKKGLAPKTKMSISISLPELSGIEVSGASVVNASGVKGELVSLDASGASRIAIAGEAAKIDLNASGASKIDAENLRCGVVAADVSGASSALVYATDKVVADASGAASVRYAGDPASVTKDTSGAGSVKRKE